MTLRKRLRHQPAESARRQQKRRHLLETLEPRQLLAGPQLIGVQPNEGALIDDGAVRTVAPRSMTFRFDEAQQIDPNTFDAIRITRAGADRLLGTSDDLVVQPGLVTLGDIRQNEVVVRFAENLPDDHYQIDVFAFDDPSAGIVALRNLDGDALVPSVVGARSESIRFRLDLGAQIEAVVPQPVVRLADGRLDQRRDEVLVYFNEDPLFVENDPATGLPTARSAENPRFYQLLLTQDTVRTTDDLLYFPERVIYDPATHTARLMFAGDINQLPGVPLGGGTFRLRIGTAVDTRDDLILEPSRLAPGGQIGDTITTAFDLNAGSGGVRFVTDGSVTSSVVIPGVVDAVPWGIQLPGGANDPGRVDLPEVAGGGLLQTINEQFGADSTLGITEIAYNFNSVYATNGGSALLNQITQRQKTRIREALSLWGNYIGVQFRETADEGITFAVGDPAELPSLGLQMSTATVRGALNASLRIDPAYAGSAMVFSNETQFNTAYGEDFFRKSMAGIGFLLGLEQSTELTQQSLMSLSTAFLNQTINPTNADGTVNLTQLRNLEPAFPGNLDILHGRHVHRPDGIDADLYRFEVDLGSGNRTGTFTAEVFSERLPDASLLDSSLRLFEEVRATATTDFGVGTALSVGLTAVQPGALGNNARIDFVRTQGGGLVIQQKVDAQGNLVPNAIEIQVPRTGTVTVASLVSAINNHPFASTLFDAEVLVGSGTTNITGAALDQPILLAGGGLTELARNDDYFSSDSLLTASLRNGIYYIGIAASGNDRYDPHLTASGDGGKSQGAYELALKFEPQVGEVDSIRDRDSDRVGVPGTALDGNGDGTPGGVKNFWFQTRPTERMLEVTVNGAAISPRQTFTLVGGNGGSRRFEFVPTGTAALAGNIAVPYDPGAINPATSPEGIATAILQAVNSVSGALGITATISADNPAVVTLVGERSVSFSPEFRGVTAIGRTVFVDKVAGVQADGSLQKPFNNISNPAVPNAFGSVSPDDIVRIVGNGGQDNDPTNNFAYKIGSAETGGGTLEDGQDMVVPGRVTVMIDAGAALKFRNSAIVVGSTSLLADRSGGVLQVLGTPRLVDLSDPVINGATTVDVGVRLLGTAGADTGKVVFTSTRDRSVDAAAAGNSPAAAAGNWAGILFTRELDRTQGRFDLEDEGIFLQTVNHADIRFGGGSSVSIESVQQTVNPIQMVDFRPNVTYNRLTNNASAAMSASPDSFEETSYQAPRYQQAGIFTADYGRVGPDIKNNVLQGNSINGLFIRAERTPSDPLRELTVAGRFDDTDIVHYIAENVIIAGNPGGSIQDGVRPQLADVAGLAVAGGGVLAAGDYRYQLTFVDRFGFESLAAIDPASITTATSDGSAIDLFNLPAVPAGADYVTRRLYRLAPGETDYRLVSELNATETRFVDNGRNSGVTLDVNRQGVRGRLNASLVIDPGTIVKLTGARIELGQGTQLLAEGLPGLPVVFTSVLDDRYGAGGSFDTNNDSLTPGGGVSPDRGNWAGIYAGPTSNVSLSSAVIAYGGGVSLLEGGQSKAFSVLELQQATARVVDSRFEFNANGQGGAGPVGRNGRLGNTPSTIFARFTQPVLVGNEFLENRGPIIDIDSDSFNADYVVDLGRQTGPLDRLNELDDNHGPLIRRNTTDSTPSDNAAARQLNGMYIRGGVLSTSSVWDDTDIVHMLFDSIIVGDQVSGGELRLQSRPDESLVVKLDGAGNPNNPTTGTGFTATGSPSSLADRIGGTIHVLGLPGAPVVLTSFEDDSVGAGRRFDGSQQTDTNGDGFGSRPFPNDWRGLYFDQFSNDRNVAVIPEQELSTEVAPGLNGTVGNAQNLGELAQNFVSGDERFRLGFEVHGFLSGPADVDVFSFNGTAGTPIWIDIDRTSVGLDSVVEILDSSGNVLARSTNSFAEADDPSLVAVVGPTLAGKVGPLNRFDGSFEERGEFGLYEDFASTNTRDAGLSVLLPGPAGASSIYFIRVRSAAVNPADEVGGLTRGGYMVQVRLREAQEFPGSVVRFADIRYSNHGIHLQGLPGQSPLLGEVGEDESVSALASNDTIDGGTILAARPQYVGNLAETKNGSVSIAGSLANGLDIDFYEFEVDFGIGTLQRSTVFDIDYAAGFSRPDTNISVFYDDGSGPRLVLMGSGSNVAEDQSSPLAAEIGELLSRGSVSGADPLIGPVSLPQGTYYVAVTSGNRLPAELTANPLVRREPVDSVRRIFDDRVEGIRAFGQNGSLPPLEGAFIAALGAGWSITDARGGDPGHQNVPRFNGSQSTVLPSPAVPGGPDGGNWSYRFDRSVTSGTLGSTAFDLAGYSAADLPRMYFDYFYSPATGDSVSVRVRSDQNPTPTNLPTSLQASPGGQTWRQAVVSLDAVAGHTGVVVEFVYNAPVPGGAGEGLYVDNFIVGFAERGEMISQATGDATGFVGGSGLTGQYQLEMRPGTEYFTPLAGGIRIDQTFDTNDRHNRSVTLVAPAGSQIANGDRFTLNDGGNSVTFEFNSVAGFTPGVTRINFAPTDTATQIAQRLINAINNPVVQATVKIKASPASSNGPATATDARVNLHGTVNGDFFEIATVGDAPGSLAATPRPGGGRVIQMPAIRHNGIGDRNTQRVQGQVLIENNRISDVRGIGIWSEPVRRPADPRDTVLFPNYQSPPPIGNTPSGVAINLPTLNDSVIGGLVSGVVVVNNIVDQAGYAGVKIDGQTRPWVVEVPQSLNIADGHIMMIDVAGTRVIMEFDDLSGVPVADGGSGQVGGDGFVDGHIPMYFRHLLTAAQYPAGGRNTPSTEAEYLVAMQQAINGSILVTNGLAGLVRASVGPSVFSTDAEPRLALYIEGATGVYFSSAYQRAGGGFPTARLAPVAEAPQPFARVVNNTIYGNDGTESQFRGSPAIEPNDTILRAVDTKAGRGHGGAFIAQGVIGDSTTPLPADRDVDLFKVELGAGDRLVVDVDTLATGPSTVLRLFDANGVPQAFLTGGGITSTVSAPGGIASHLNPTSTTANPIVDAVNGRDGFIDFTATAKGTYYVGVASLGNDEYDPLSLAGRKAGIGGTGTYTIGIEVLAPRDLVLSLDNRNEGINGGTRAGALIGTTFTITQIPDYNGAGVYAAVNPFGNRVTFEFSNNTGGFVLPNGNINVPLRTDGLNGGYRVPDIMRAIADAIGRTVGGVPALPNHQLGDGPEGRNGPVSRITATALGGVGGNNNGINTTFLTDYGTGFGHNRLENGSFSVPTDSGLSGGNGTSELYVLVEKAVRIELSAAARAAGLKLTPDQATPEFATEADQLLAETGVLITQGASPTLLNNVFINLHQSVVADETNLQGFGAFAAVNNFYKAQQVVVTGNVFQYDDPRNSTIRRDVSSPFTGDGNSGISTDANRGPSNVNGGTTDFNFIVPGNVRVLENAAGDRMIPATNSPIIDSAVNSLGERDRFGALKASVGLPLSNILAPNRDHSGQLRADDPTVASPGGLGSNVFKDRGALDRADFVGPAAVLEFPRDNDAAGIDTDPTETFLQLESGVYDEFRILLRDTGDASDPFVGSGIDDATVVVPVLPGVRQAGANIALFEGDRLLAEGVDYTFSYDATRGLITLRPLAGIWRNDRAYRISINNEDRLVALAPGANAIGDGDSFVVVDRDGGRVTFEFESGYELKIPETLQFTVPQAGTGTGGIADGSRFSISGITGNPVFFEFDRDGVVLPGSRVIPFATGDSPGAIAAAARDTIQAAVTAGLLDVTPIISQTENTRVVIGSEAGTVLDVSRTALIASPRTIALSVPSIVAGPGGIVDGDTFTISDGNRTERFEFDTDGNFGAANIRVNIGGMTQADSVRDAVLAAVDQSSLNLSPFLIGDLVFLNLPAGGSAVVESGQLSTVGISRTVSDGSRIVFTQPGGAPFTFVLDRTDAAEELPVGDAVVPLTREMTGDQLAERIAAAIRGRTIAGLDTSAVFANAGGLVSVGGQAPTLDVAGLGLAVDPASTIEVVGQPGVSGSSVLTIFGPLLVQVPIVGGSGMIDDSQFFVTDGVSTVTFQYNLTLTGASNPLATQIDYQEFDDVEAITAATVNAINASVLNITAVNLGGGRISLGDIAESQFGFPTAVPPQQVVAAPLTATRGIVNDGEQILITQGTQTLRFEFDAATGGGGVSPGFIPVVFQPGSSVDSVAAVLAAAINNNRGGLTLNARALPGGRVALQDTSQTVVDVSSAPTVDLSGTPGGAIAVEFNGSYGPVEMKLALIAAINQANAAGKTPLQAVNRGGGTLFIENGLLIDGALESYFLQAVKDLAGNPLKPNRSDNTTQFTLLMPTVGLDYGDAPDPRGGVAGRYPTLLANDGARHVVDPDGVRLGKWVDVDSDGMPSALADGDDTTIFAVGTSGPLFTSVVRSGYVEVSFNLTGPLAGFDGNTVTISTGVDTATMEFDVDGLFNENNFAVGVNPSAPVTAADIAAAFKTAVEESPLRPAAVEIVGDTVRIITNDEDGVVFTSDINPLGVLNPGMPLEISVEVTGSGVVEAWIDFNFDGDWDDPNEQIIDGSTPRTISSPQPGVEIQTFVINVPANSPRPSSPTSTYARFRVSNEGGLTPTGLALSGEVEDYRLMIMPGLPPIVNSSNNQLNYRVNEDGFLVANRTDGSTPPAGVNDRGILVGIVDPDGDQIGVYVADVGQRVLRDAAGAEAGRLNLLANGEFTFEPTADYFGEVVFTARVTDIKPSAPETQLLSPVALTITITVDPVNDPPLVTGASPVIERTILEDTTVTFTAAELTAFFTPGPANEAGQPLSIQSAGVNGVGFQTLLGGVVQIVDGNLRYTPPLDYSGSVRDQFNYVVADDPQDANQLVETAATLGTVFITIDPVNDPPIVGNDFFEFDGDGPFTIPISGPTGILTNDSAGPPDEVQDGQQISLELGDFPRSTSRGGQVRLSTDGLTLVYTPPANFTGVDQFDYRVTDTGQPPETSTGTVFVTVNGENSPPVFVGVNGDPNARSLTFNESGQTEQVFEYNLNTWFTDPEGDASTFAVEVIGAAGAAQIIEASVVTGDQGSSVLRLRLLSYRSGEVTLRIVATNVNDGPQSTTDIPVTVNDVNNAPRLIGSLDPLDVDEDEVVVRNLSTIFSDPDGDVLTYRVSRIGGINNPTAAQIAASGLVQSVTFAGGVMTINLVPDAFGSVSMEVTASDAELSVAHAFNLNVAPQPDEPRGVADQFGVSYGGRLQVSNRSGGVLANDVNPDVVPISSQGLRVDLASVTNPAKGTLQMNEDGTFVYTNLGRVPSDSATDSFTYRPINANNQLGNVVTVTIRLTASSYQNPIPGFQFDVTADGAISPIDALRIINLLSTRRVSGVPVSELTTPPPDFYDVDGSGVISPLDAILVINEIARRNRLAQGVGEGEQVSAALPESVWLASTSEVFASSAITLPEVEPERQASAFTFDDLTSDPFENVSDGGDDPADLLADDLISLRQSSEAGDGAAEASDEALLSWFAAD